MKKAVAHEQEDFVDEPQAARFSLGWGLIERNHDINSLGIGKCDDIGRRIFLKKALMDFADFVRAREEKIYFAITEI